MNVNDYSQDYSSSYFLQCLSEIHLKSIHYESMIVSLCQILIRRWFDDDGLPQFKTG